MKKIEEVKNRVKKSVDKARYNYNDAAPWLKHYDRLGYSKTLMDRYPDCSIYEQLEKAVKRWPNNDAFEYFGKKETFSGFDERIKRCAQSLLNIGVTPEDTVTILMPNTPEGIIMFYACNLIGAVASMVHPLSSEEEIIHCMNKTKSNYVLTLNALYDKLHVIQDRVNMKKIILARVNESMSAFISTMFTLTKGRKIKIENKFADNVVMWRDFIYEGKETPLKRSIKESKELAVILFSGGTTGDSKAIMHNNYTFNANTIQLLSVCPSATPGSSILTLLPIFHGFGLGVCFHTAMTNGMKAIIIPKFTPEEFPKLIKNYKPNFIAGVPTLFEALTQADLPDNSLNFISTVVCGGDLLTPELQKRVNNFLKAKGSKAEIRVGWGMTECISAATATPEDNFIPGSIGIPSPDMYAKIVKPGTTENVYYDTDGELCISGPIVMMGYLDDEEETANTLRTHDDGKVWLHTGDMCSMDKDGMIFFKARIKRMIISGGYNVYPSVIENALNAHPKVLTSIVVGEQDSYRGEVPIAYVVLKPKFTGDDATTQEIMEHCKKHLSKYMLPTKINYRETLPQTKIGKADYRNVK